jgi:hypothetical protein
MSPGQFATHAEMLVAIARSLSRVNLPGLLATVEAEQHTAVLGKASPTLLRDAIAAAAVVQQLAPLAGQFAAACRPPHPPASRSVS